MTDTVRGGDRRRSPRTLVDLRVELKSDAWRGELRAIDVAQHGVFLGTTEALPLHTALQLRIHIAPGEAVEASGTVVRILRPDRIARGEMAGMGVQLAPMAPPAQQRWEAFCAELARHRPPHDERRLFQRIARRLQVNVHAESTSDLEAFWTQNLSLSGALFETDLRFEPGTRLDLIVIHPETGARYPLPGEVVRCEATDRGNRVAVRFDGPAFEVLRRLTGVD